MNEKIYKLLLVKDKIMPEMHLRQPEFTYSACRTFTKKKERIQKFKETSDSKYILQNELDKACIQHDMAFGDFKDLPRRTIADKILHDKVFNIAKNLKHDGNQRRVASMVYKFFDEKTASHEQSETLVTRHKYALRGVVQIAPNEELANELNKSIIRKTEKQKYIHLL